MLKLGIPQIGNSIITNFVVVIKLLYVRTYNKLIKMCLLEIFLIRRQYNYYVPDNCIFTKFIFTIQHDVSLRNYVKFGLTAIRI